jgi:hypothetical protein
MRAGFEAELLELLGLRLLRAFRNLQSDGERLRVVEYVEALDTKAAEAKVGPIVRLVASKLESDAQNDPAPGNTV